ncbi:hypothetical protein Tco_1521380 [Tanacetum coccineum]
MKSGFLLLRESRSTLPILNWKPLCHRRKIHSKCPKNLDALAEVHNHDNVNKNMINQAVQYVIESQQAAVQNSNSSAQQDALLLSVIDQLKSQLEQVKVLKEGQNVDLRINDNVSDSSAQSVEIDRLKQTLSEHLKEKESLMQTVSLLKDDFKKEESRNIDREIALEKRI